MDKNVKEKNKNLPKSLWQFKSIILTYSLTYLLTYSISSVSSVSVRPVNIIKLNKN